MCRKPKVLCHGGDVPFVFAVFVTLWLFNIAMENCPFTDYTGFSIAILNTQMVLVFGGNYHHYLVQ
jgi:hypothetical protein